ncbi:LOW QUALITY PROTEIN: ankyrin repeat domain-containing protein 2 [Talpa occidentalis]|uniref:LOW QUALITY PROTEIN: ankyrin repeat domain-containing protein 2 n=1 Tax=Talpa occidentalis TaxID=50954 RepID=UPI0023F8E955|nr:LOW QUALITY PROTEIN: ankyrin repeat domain-containing protein 2 [Talpa occidentalis]
MQAWAAQGEGDRWGRQVENWARDLIAKAPGREGGGTLAYKAPEALWLAEAITHGTMAASEAVQRATELIEQRLAQEEENEKLQGAACQKVAMDMLVLEDEKQHGAQSLALHQVKGQERVRKTSLDLRREIIDVGGIQNLIELRKKRKQKKREALAAAQEPPAEPEEIAGPVDEEMFLKAAVEGKLKVVEKFLADGGPVDTCDQFRRTALHRASLEGHMEILEKLLESGATVDFQDRLDCTAMHWACRGGHLEVVKLLQSRGADTNVRDKLLSTPLHVAVRTGHVEVVEYFLSLGLDINAKDREGDSALHDAVRLNRYKIIKLLLLHGADMMTKNLAGKTPTDLVQLWQADTRQALEHPEPEAEQNGLVGPAESGQETPQPEPAQ